MRSSGRGKCQPELGLVTVSTNAANHILGGAEERDQQRWDTSVPISPCWGAALGTLAPALGEPPPLEVFVPWPDKAMAEPVFCWQEPAGGWPRALWKLFPTSSSKPTEMKFGFTSVTTPRPQHLNNKHLSPPSLQEALWRNKVVVKCYQM